MLIDSMLIMLPIIVLDAGGFFSASRFSVSEDMLVRIIIDFLMPMLIFYALYTGEVKGGEVASLAGSATFVVVVLTLFTLIYAKLLRYDFRSLTPPVIFMNSCSLNCLSTHRACQKLLRSMWRMMGDSAFPFESMGSRDGQRVENDMPSTLFISFNWEHA